MYKIHSTATVSDPGETKKIYNQNQPLDLPAAVLAVAGGCRGRWAPPEPPVEASLGFFSCLLAGGCGRGCWGRWEQVPPAPLG